MQPQIIEPGSTFPMGMRALIDRVYRGKQVLKWGIDKIRSVNDGEINTVELTNKVNRQARIQTSRVNRANWIVNKLLPEITIMYNAE